MNDLKSPEEYLIELQVWKLAALRLSPSGRFLGYDRLFLNWIDQHLVYLFNGETITTEARWYFEEARRRIELENDDLFAGICERLDRALSLASEVAYDILKADLDAFKEMCATEGITPTQKINEWIRTHVRERRN